VSKLITHHAAFESGVGVYIHDCVVSVFYLIQISIDEVDVGLVTNIKVNIDWWSFLARQLS
jgi:hypothetical protein